jgi:vanillate O-demethylase monooxygenase subunit
MYLKNAWYVAAWSDEISARLTPLEILGERVVLYRTPGGACAALEDACPHRKLPLSMGRLVDDTVVCGYHGLTFNGSGTCVAAPTSGSVPPKAAVRAYPVTERYDLVWIWMGDTAAIDPALIPDIAEWGQPAWGYNRGAAMLVDCHYLYVVDNLLDPTHVTWVHPGSFGNNSCAATPVESTPRADGVTASRWMADVEPAAFYKRHLKFAGRCDRYQHYEMRYPCNAIIKAIFVPAGTGGKDQPLHPDAFVMDSYNFLTPVNARQTRYFWFQLRNFAPDNAAVSQEFTDDITAAFEEDRLILNAVQIGMNGKSSPTIDLRNDFSSYRFRKTLAARIASSTPN